MCNGIRSGDCATNSDKNLKINPFPDLGILAVILKTHAFDYIQTTPTGCVLHGAVASYSESRRSTGTYLLIDFSFIYHFFF